MPSLQRSSERDPASDPTTQVASRSRSGRVLFIEDFRAPGIGFWNDGVGSCTRDTDIIFAGLPSMRLDPQGQVNSGATNPGRTAATNGVVAKRRIHDGFTGRFGVEMWFRMTSLNLTSNAFLSMSLYNRDGTDAHHSRVWLDPNGNNQPMIAKILDGAASVAAGNAVYAAASTSLLQNGGGSHTYDLPTGRLDRAGGWHWVKLVTDLNAKKYVSVQIDGQAPVDLSAYTTDTTASSGFAGMHFSVEFSATTSTARYVNVARIVGTAE
jgi:hypothetical protein